MKPTFASTGSRLERGIRDRSIGRTSPSPLESQNATILSQRTWPRSYSTVSRPTKARSSLTRRSNCGGLCSSMRAKSQCGRYTGENCPAACNHVARCPPRCEPTPPPMIENLKRTIWATAVKLRPNMDPAEYKRLVLGSIFGRYVSDTFQAKGTAMTARLAGPADESHRSQSGR